MSLRNRLSPNQIIVLIALGWALVLGVEALLLYRLTPPAPPPTPVAPATVGQTPPVQPQEQIYTAPGAPLPTTAPALVAPTPAVFVAPGVRPNAALGIRPAENSPRIAANPGNPLPLLPPPPGLNSKNASQNDAAKTAFEAGAAALRAGDKTAALAEFERAVQLAPANLPSQLNLASLYLDLKQPAKAVPHLQIVAARDPKNAAVQFTLARALLADKKLDAALTPLRKTVQLAPDEKEARVLLAQVLFDLKKHGDSYAQWSELARRNPKDASLQLQAASMAGEVLKKPDDAEKWLRRAVSAAPREPRPALALGQLLLRKKDAKGAAQVLGEAAKQSPDAFAIYPLLADARTASGDTKGATSALQSALQKLPKGKSDAEQKQIKATEGALRLALGRTLGASKQNKDARVQFEKAAALLPRDPQPRALAGVAALQLKDNAGAIANFQKALALDPKRAADRKTLAQLLADSKKWKDADSQFALYAKSQPKDAEALVQWSQVAAQLKNPKRQIEVLGKAAQAAPKNAAVWTQLALAQRAQGDKKAALISFEKLAKLRPKDADVLYETAKLQSELGDNAGAYENWKDVVEARPKVAEVYSALLEAADKAGQNSNARLFLVRELAQSENLAALKGILDFYSRKNRPSEARAFLNDLVARAPDQDAARTALNALKGAGETPTAKLAP